MSYCALLGDSTTISYDGNLIAKLEGSQFSYEIDMVECTNYDSGGFKTYRPGLAGAELSFDSMRDAGVGDGTYNGLIDQLITNKDASVDVIFADTDASVSISFVGFFSKLDLNTNAPGDKQTYSGTIQPSGGFTVTGV